MSDVRDDAQSTLLQLCFLDRLPGPGGQSIRQNNQLSKVLQNYIYPDNRELIRTEWEKIQKGVQDLKNEALKQQLKNNVKRMLKQQQEMAAIWRDLIKIDDAILIRKMRNPDPVISLIAIQLAGKKRLPVEKECIVLLGSTNPSIRQAARQTLIRLGRSVDFGPEPTATPQQITASVRSWSNWSAIQTEEPPEEKTDDAEDKDPS